MRASVVVLIKLPGVLPVKTRLWPELGADGAADLFRVMVRETLLLARAFDPRPIVAYSPFGADPQVSLPDLRDCAWLPVRAQGGAAGLEEALAAAYAGRPLLALGGDAPDLPPTRVAAALRALEHHDACFVPTADGGFSCGAFARPLAGLADGMRYGATDTLVGLERWCGERGLRTTRTEPWNDIDTAADLRRWRAGTRPEPTRPSGGRITPMQDEPNGAAADSGFGTRAIHAGQSPDPTTGAIMTPIYQTSTYVQEAPAQHKGYVYARGDNPTRKALEGCLAALEEAEFCTATSSGLGAETVVLTDLGAGARVVAGNDLYGGTYRLFEKVFRRMGLEFAYVDTTDPEQVRAALREKTDLLWVETPTNPTLKITDIEATAAIAREAGTPLLVDNTFASPYLQQPLTLGANVVVHSMTKYLGGHSDVIGGCVLTSDAERADRYAKLANWTGPVPAPLDSFLVLRGLKTLHVRVERHCENAAYLASWLVEHPRVRAVHYPGLKSHPGFEIAQRQMRAGGGMVSIELDGSVEDGKRFCSATEIFALAESLGGVESLIEHPASMTHASVPAEERRKAGFADGLIRLSVGIEDAADLRDDLEQAFAKTYA